MIQKNVRVDANDTDGEDDHDDLSQCMCKQRERCCFDDSCVNYATQVECVNCNQGCQNQRFKRKVYAKISVRETPDKGFGLFAEEALPARTFVYEYLGEVLSFKELNKRLGESKHERHLFAMQVGHNTLKHMNHAIHAHAHAHASFAAHPQGVPGLEQEGQHRALHQPFVRAQLRH